MNSKRLEAITDFVRNLVTAVSNASLFTPDHPQVLNLCTAALDNLRIALADTGELSFLLVDDELVADGVRLETNLYLGKFMVALKARGVGHLRLIAGIRSAELLSLIGDLRRGAAVTEMRSLEHVRFGRVEVRTAVAEGGTDPGGFPVVPDIRDLAEGELLCLMDIYAGVRRYRRLKVSGVSEIVARFAYLLREAPDALSRFLPDAAPGQRIFTHGANVCILNLRQAMALGIGGALLQDIGISGLLHDIGKLFIPEEVLTKTEPLDDAELELMGQHPVRGAVQLLHTPGVPQLAVLAAYEHHMHYDFTGYPGMGGHELQHLVSQMTAVSDTVDLLQGPSPEGEGGDGTHLARTLLELAGTRLHPALVRNFLSTLGGPSQP